MTQEYYKCYKKSLELQGPQLTDTLDPYYQTKYHRNYKVIDLLTVGVFCVMLGMFLMTGIKYCDKVTEKPMPKNCMECHRQMAMADYFRKNGSKSPEEMAYGVLQTNNPRLLAAIAVVESNGNTHLRNTGYKRRHHGAFQVNPKYHGKVGNTAVEQALQAERILTELTQEYPIKTALKKYGGDSSDKYSQRVLAELVRTP